jgi:hypothetical protein
MTLHDDMSTCALYWNVPANEIRQGDYIQHPNLLDTAVLVEDVRLGEGDSTIITVWLNPESTSATWKSRGQVHTMIELGLHDTDQPLRCVWRKPDPTAESSTSTV